ncbi:MAG TPA: hypothetical protein DCQ32_11210 [Cyanobacteria bacterium UBA8156]|nr:hypothetical protein [Cyanobacteria bacterium UBA8156]
MVAVPQVLTAIETLNYRVTVGDVAAQSGLGLAVAQQELLNLAIATGGDLQVAESGDVAYVFAPNFRQVLQQNVWRERLREQLRGVWRWLFWLIRISFGLLLIVAIAIVVLGILAAWLALQSSKNSDSDSRSEGRSSRSGGGGPVFVPQYIFLGDPWGPWYPDYYQRRSRPAQKSEMGFLEGVFSFLFGDGDPNADLETERYRAIASVIYANGGAVTAEQLTPYLDDDGEAAVLPVLVKFNGFPEVSEQGDIAYRFPELQTVATYRQLQTTPPYLTAKTWTFSRAGSGNIGLAVGLGCFYLIGALILGGLLGEIAAQGIAVGAFLQFVSGAYGLLLGYAILFLTVPAVRYLVLQTLVNPPLIRRNQERAARAEAVRSPSPELRQKLAFARQLAADPNVVSTQNLAYTTETDLLDQAIEP